MIAARRLCFKLGFLLGVITPGFSVCAAISIMLKLDCRAPSSCGVRYWPMVKVDPLDEFRFFNFRGAGRAGGGAFVGEVGEAGFESESPMGDSTCSGFSISPSINQLTPSHLFTSRFVVSSTSSK
jgi:hypothetical protein